MNRFIPVRVLYLFIFIACAALLGYGLYLQHVQGLEPCPMCVLQRYAFVAVGFSALVAAVHDPVSTGRYAYSGVIVLFSIAGGGVALRHAWLQHFPPPSQGCGADIGYLLEVLPLSQALPAMFRGTGECSEVGWRFFGLSIPEWALVWFAAFVAISVFILVMTARRRA